MLLSISSVVVVVVVVVVVDDVADTGGGAVTDDKSRPEIDRLIVSVKGWGNDSSILFLKTPVIPMFSALIGFIVLR